MENILSYENYQDVQNPFSLEEIKVLFLFDETPEEVVDEGILQKIGRFSVRNKKLLTVLGLFGGGYLLGKYIALLQKKIRIEKLAREEDDPKDRVRLRNQYNKLSQEHIALKYKIKKKYEKLADKLDTEHYTPREHERALRRAEKLKDQITDLERTDRRFTTFMRADIERSREH